jgi:hypothetical protein
MYLDDAIAEVQRDAASWPTDLLRSRIIGSLEALSQVIGDLGNAPGPGILCDGSDGCASCMVLTAALITSLYVRELAYRPAERPAARIEWADFSCN